MSQNQWLTSLACSLQSIASLGAYLVLPNAFKDRQDNCDQASLKADPQLVNVLFDSESLTCMVCDYRTGFINLPIWSYVKVNEYIYHIIYLVKK